MDTKTYLSRFDKAEKINKGMAGDDKYRCRRGAEEYLLRVADIPNTLKSSRVTSTIAL